MKRRLLQIAVAGFAYAASFSTLGNAQNQLVIEDWNIPPGIAGPDQACSFPQPILPRVNVADLSLEGDHLPPADEQHLAAEIKDGEYTGSPDVVKGEMVERARAAWMDHGYFEPVAEGEVKVLTSSPVSERVAVTIRIRAGQQYRLGWIRFANNHAIRNLKALRSTFAVHDGDIFDREKIAQGLEDLRKLYGDLGYINFTSVPDTQVDANNSVVNLLIDVDEGKQFYISNIDTAGLDESASQAVLKDALQKRGDLYNRQLMTLSLQRYAAWLRPGVAQESRIRLRPDERTGTVAVTFDFQPCPPDAQPAQ